MWNLYRRRSSYERKNCFDWRTQYSEPGILRSAGSDQLGRAAHQRHLRVFEYPVQDPGRGKTGISDGHLWRPRANLSAWDVRGLQRDEKAHGGRTAAAGSGDQGSAGGYADRDRGAGRAGGGRPAGDHFPDLRGKGDGGVNYFRGPGYAAACHGACEDPDSQDKAGQNRGDGLLCRGCEGSLRGNSHGIYWREGAHGRCFG